MVTWDPRARARESGRSGARELDSPSPPAGVARCGQRCRNAGLRVPNGGIHFLLQSVQHDLLRSSPPYREILCAREGGPSGRSSSPRRAPGERTCRRVARHIRRFEPGAPHGALGRADEAPSWSPLAFAREATGSSGECCRLWRQVLPSLPAGIPLICRGFTGLRDSCGPLASARKYYPNGGMGSAP